MATMTTAIQLRPEGLAPRLRPSHLPALPWRDPHAVPPEKLAEFIASLTEACALNPGQRGHAHLPWHCTRHELRRLPVDGRARGSAAPSSRKISSPTQVTPNCSSACGSLTVPRRKPPGR